MYSAFVLCLLAVGFTAIYTNEVAPRNTVVIRNPKSQLVIAEKPDKSVVASHFKENDVSQLWVLEATRKGTFFILNKGSGYALEKALDSNYSRTAPHDECKDQQWHIDSDKTILNAESKRILDIKGSVYEEGTPILVYEVRDSPNQEFVVEAA